MQIVDGTKLKEIIIVGDRVLIKPKKTSQKTNTGLYLPHGVKEKEKVQSGIIVKAGPGYPMPFATESEEPWKPQSEEKVKYIPLQAEEGDEAVYLQSNAFEITYGGEKYMIVPHSAILMLVRAEEL